MRTRIVIASTTVAWGALIACGGADDTAQRFPVADDFDTAIEQLATAHCERWQACDPLGLALYYVDQGSCHATLAGVQREAVKRPGSKLVPADLSRYANEVVSANCEWFARNNRIFPQKPGSYIDGSTCISSIQCQSLNCRYINDSGCGVCAQPLQAGETCFREPCAEGNICETSSSSDAGMCIRLGLLGESCYGSHPCAIGLACVSGICSPAQGVGAPCIDQAGCGVDLNLYCGADGKCRAIRVAQAGEVCGTVNGEQLRCVYSTSTCRLVGGSAEGTCVVRAPLGENCDPDAGFWCEQSLDCVDGICTTPDTSSCQ